MKNKNIFISILIIIIINIFLGVWIFKFTPDEVDKVTCFITLIAGSIGGFGTLIAVGISNSMTGKQLILSIIYTWIEEIKELIKEILNINNLIIGLKHLNVSNKHEIEECCNKLIDAINKIRADLIAIRNKELKNKLVKYLSALNSKICDLKYSEIEEESSKFSIIIQGEMLNIQEFQIKLEEELRNLYEEIDNI